MKSKLFSSLPAGFMCMMLVLSANAGYSQTTVTTVSPGSYAFAGTSTTVQVTFSGPMLTSSFNDTISFIVSGTVSGIHSGSFGFTNGNATVTFTPDSAFTEGEAVTIAVTNALLDSSSIPITSYHSTFTTNVVAAPGIFPTRTDYGVSYPADVVASDLDGDGDVDIAFPISYSGAVSICKNNGNGTFASAVNYTTAQYPRVITAADIDNDGDIDLATASYQYVSVLKNNGDGTFTSRTDYTFYNVSRIGISDLNGDGYGDIVITNQQNSSISVMMNSGTGTFGSAVNYPASYYPSSVSSGDLDDDGDLDLTVVSGSTGTSFVSIYKNNGDGTFATRVDYTTGDQPADVCIADIDGDADGDIIVANANGHTISVFKNNGDATFAAKIDYSTGGDNILKSIKVSDVDGDGDGDLVFVKHSGPNSVTIRKNDGTGTFGAQTNYSTGSYPNKAVDADINNDGVVDLVVTYGFASGGFSVLPGLQPDPTAPLMQTVLPVDNGESTNGLMNLTITFDDLIQSVAGKYIKIYNSSDVLIEQIPAVDGRVTVSGAAVTINPDTVLADGGFYILIESGAFTNFSNVPFSGITDTTVWNFTVSDPGPSVVTISPASGDSIRGNSNLGITLDASVTAQSGKYIFIYTTNDALIEQIPANDGRVTVNAAQITVNPNSELVDGGYYVKIDSGAFKDAALRDFGGVNDETSWQFTVATPSTDGIPGTALSFPGSGNNYASVPYTSELNPSDNFTIELWARVDGGSGMYRCPLASEDTYFGSSNGYYFYANNANTWVAYLGVSAGWAILTGPTAVIGRWYHLALTYSGGTTKFYVDGSLQQTVGSISFSPNATRPFNIGDLSEINGLYPFNGAVDEVRLWNIARTGQQIRENMHRTVAGSTNNLIAYFQLNEGTGSSINEVVTGYSGSLVGSPSWVTSTVAVGPGSSASSTGFTTGTASLGSVSLTTSDGFDNAIDLVAANIDASPNSVPSGVSTVLNDRYWVVDTFGTAGTYSTNISFTIPESFSHNGNGTLASYVLFSRGSNADTNFTVLVSGASALSATTVTFDGVSSFGQFVLGTDYVYPSTDSVPGYALSIPGTGGKYVNVPYSSTLNPSDNFTVEFWARVEGGSDYRCPLGTEDGAAQTGYYFYVSPDYFGNHWQCWMGHGNGSVGDWAVIDGIPASDSVWYHLAMTYQSDTLKFYVNGILQGNLLVQFAVNPSFPLRIGGLAESESVFGWNGKIDEVRIWGTARSQEDIRKNMHRKVPTNSTDLIAYFQMNEGSGSTTTDVASGFTGTLVGSPSWVASTIPVGSGTSATQSSFSTGTANLGTVSMTMTNDFDNAVDLTATKIDVAPNSTTGITGTTLSDQYWIMNSFGTPGTFAANLTFTVPSTFTNNGAGSPSNYTLYHRSANDDGNWTAVVNGAASITGTTLTFNGVNSFSQFTIGTEEALPVELTSFTVTTNNQNVELKWGTAAEVNNHGFEVQRSEVRGQKSENGGHSERSEESRTWTTSGFVEGNGTSSAPKDYSFRDKNLKAGRYMYRLKQIDRDGKFSYSYQVEVEFGKAPRVFALSQNYPNPFNPSTSIEFTLPEDGRATMKVYDLLGREVAKVFDGDVKAGFYQKVTVDGSRMASGVYFVRIEYKERSLLKKMMLLK